MRYSNELLQMYTILVYMTKVPREILPVNLNDVTKSFKTNKTLFSPVASLM